MATRGAVVLLSGGLDSATTLVVARSQGFDLYALTFDYGQRHRGEVVAARAVAERHGVRRHMVTSLDLRAVGGSALTDDIPVPKGPTPARQGHEIPVTYVPARNTIFLAFALAWAEVLGVQDIFIGVNALDYSGYPDCRPEYLEAFQRMADLATRAGVEGRQRLVIHAPLIQLSKAQIVRRAVELGVALDLTWSCYDPSPDGAACGQCDACQLRLKGFREAGVADPARYATSPASPAPPVCLLPLLHMTYAVKEVFYTLQGEGQNTGRPAVFLRFAGCNLWSGREADRSSAICQFCDTDFIGTDGPGGGRFETPEALAEAVAASWPASSAPSDPRLVVCTGGEPTLQMDTALTSALHRRGFEVAIETNGTLPLPPGVDWVCVSPKAGTNLVLRAGDELKLIYPQPGAEPERYEWLDFRHFFLQPMDGPDREGNTRQALDYCLRHPRWRLSLQTHKVLGIP